jgi:hypothetical protein
MICLRAPETSCPHEQSCVVSICFELFDMKSDREAKINILVSFFYFLISGLSFDWKSHRSCCVGSRLAVRCKKSRCLNYSVCFMISMLRKMERCPFLLVMSSKYCHRSVKIYSDHLLPQHRNQKMDGMTQEMVGYLFKQQEMGVLVMFLSII